MGVGIAAGLPLFTFCLPLPVYAGIRCGLAGPHAAALHLPDAPRTGGAQVLQNLKWAHFRNVVHELACAFGGAL